VCGQLMSDVSPSLTAVLDSYRITGVKAAGLRIRMSDTRAKAKAGASYEYALKLYVEWLAIAVSTLCSRDMNSEDNKRTVS
jgi:hypothetical protein